MFSEIFLQVVPPAFLMGFSHCLFMCGGFSVILANKLSSKSSFVRLLLQLGYHISRVFAYMILGMLAGTLGRFFTFASNLSSMVRFISGMLLVVIGFALLFRGSILKFIENDYIWKKFFYKHIGSIVSSKSNLSVLVLGFFNGFLPCGVVYTFLAISIIQSNPLKGVLVMFLFGIATLFAMIILMLFASVINDKFKKYSMSISSVFIIILGLYNSYIGFMST